MKRILSLILCVLLCAAGSFAAFAATSGTCGVNVRWSFTQSSGTLKITGSGDMQNYASYTDIPWNEHINGIRSVQIENGVTAIGDYAFMECESLQTVSIPNSLRRVGKCAFTECTSLSSVSLPDAVTEIGSMAFYGCVRLTGFNIPKGITQIPDCMFDMSGLTSITIPNTITAIGASAFAWCRNLKSVTIPSSVQTIGKRAFEACNQLKSIVLPSGIAVIAVSTFEDCEALETITIPASVTRVEEDAFWGTGLKTVQYTGTKTQWDAIKIDDGNRELTSAKLTTQAVQPDNPTPGDPTPGQNTLKLNADTVILQYKLPYSLSASEPVTWRSSDPSIVTIGADGAVTTHAKGMTTITATSLDGERTATCNIDVYYSWWQQLIRIFLFGFIWY